MNCQLFLTQIAEPDLSSEARAHLVACAGCLAKREVAAVSRLVGEMAKVEAPSDFDFRLRARLARGAGSPTPGKFWFWRIPAGATLAGIVGLGLWIGSSMATTPPPGAATALNTNSAQSLASLAEATPPTMLPAIPNPEIAVEKETPVFSQLRSYRRSSTFSRPPQVESVQPRSERTLISGDLSLGPGHATLPTGSVTFSLPATPGRVKIELENQQTGKRFIYIDALTFGRQGQTRSVAAVAPESIVW